MKKKPILLLVLLVLGFASLGQSNVKFMSLTVRPNGDTVYRFLHRRINVTPVIIKPVPSPTSSYIDSIATDRYIIATSGFTPGDTTISSIPNTIAGRPALARSGHTHPALGSPYPTKEGYMLMQNQAAINFQVKYGNTPITKEIWLVMLKPNFYIYEAYMGIFDVPYIGEFGSSTSGLRVKAAADFAGDVWQYAATIPYNQIMVIRYQIETAPATTNPQVQVSINNVSLGGVGNTLPCKSNTLGIGTDGQNCASFGWYETFDTPPLTSTQANKVYAELSKKYQIAVPIQEPYADNIKLSRIGSTITASYTYQNPLGFAENVSARKVRWIKSVGTVSYFSPTNAVYNHSYDNLVSITAGSTESWRVEITVTDTQGNTRSLPESNYVN